MTRPTLADVPRLKRMTARRAVQVLIHHAAKNVAGVGCGIRPIVSDEEREELSQAVRTMWKHGYGWPMSESDWFNLRLNPPRDTP